MKSKYEDEIIARVNEYVDPDVYDRDELIEYLCGHNIIESEVFKICFKGYHSYRGREERVRIAETVHYGSPVTPSRTRVRLPDQSTGFYPVDITVFLDRMPFYFFINKTKYRFGGFCELALAYKMYEHSFDFIEKVEENAEFWNSYYEALEFMFYDAHLTLKDIFTYISTQTPSSNSRYDLFAKWVRYIKLCLKLGSTDYTPINLLFSLNTLLEANGEDPIIYCPDESMGYNEYFERTPGSIIFGGEFPINPETGEVVKRWLGIWVENEKYIRSRWFMESLDDEEEENPMDRHYLHCEIEVGLLPETIIYAANIHYDLDIKIPEEYTKLGRYIVVWSPVYFGPKLLTFNFDVIKNLREQYKWKQEDVANRIGVNTRTYQNWEAHSTMPDAEKLMRLMNLFNIQSVQSLMTTPYIFDPEYEKYKTGCALSFFLPRKDENS